MIFDPFKSILKIQRILTTLYHYLYSFYFDVFIFFFFQADLGLFAVPSSDVLDIMSRDHYEKYEEYMSVMAERKNRQLATNRTTYSTSVKVESHQLANFIEKAVQETAEWNKKMNQEK